MISRCKRPTSGFQFLIHCRTPHYQIVGILHPTEVSRARAPRITRCCLPQINPVCTILCHCDYSIRTQQATDDMKSAEADNSEAVHADESRSRVADARSRKLCVEQDLS